MSEWISVNNRLPDTKGNYICLFDSGVVDAFDFDPAIDSKDYWGYTAGEVVTHWQPLPDPPEKDYE